MVWTWVWPSSLPIMVRLSPSASARLAKLWRRSWMRTSSRPARARMRRQGCCKLVRWAPGFPPTMTQGLSRAQGKAVSTPAAARDGGTIRAPVLLSGNRSSPASRSTLSQRSVWTSPSRQPVSISGRMAPVGKWPGA